MKKILVAFQGEPGAFSEEAIFNLLGEKAEALPCANFEEMFRALLEKRAEYALAPMKNSLVGEITRPNELLAENNLRVVDTYKMYISLSLIACEGAKFEDLQTVESHYVALGQCKHFFAENPQLAQRVGSDTASSVRKVIEDGDLSRAAIASKRTIEIYGGQILRENLQDVQDNFTTFYLLGN